MNKPAKTNTEVAQVKDEKDVVAFYAEKLRTSWHSSVLRIFEAAEFALKAQTELSPDQKKALITELGGDRFILSRYAKIGKSSRFNEDVKKRLPANYTLICDLARMEDDEWLRFITSGKLTPGLTRKILNAWRHPAESSQNAGPDQPAPGSTPGTTSRKFVIEVEEQLEPEIAPAVEDLLFKLKQIRGCTVSSVPNAREKAREKFIRQEGTARLLKFLKVPRFDPKYFKSSEWEVEEIRIGRNASAREVRDKLEFVGIGEAFQEIEAAWEASGN